MPANTPNRLYPYPLPADPFDVPGDLQRLAEAIDDDVCALTNGVVGRPVSRFRGTSDYASPSPALDLAISPAVRFRVPFDLIDFNFANVTMQSQAFGNRLLFPEDPGFYRVVGIQYMPNLTLAASVEFLALEIRKCDVTNPSAQGIRVDGNASRIPVAADDRNARALTIGTAVFMNGTTDAFSLEWRADTTPDVAEYVINERSMTILKMTQS
jgi:hypothetical protein